jgi:hypothetical protein
LRIFKTKAFARFAKHEQISDSTLCEAIERAENGLIDADLGGSVIKQRVRRDGRRGRSKGYRVLIAFRMKKTAVFIHGFAKSQRSNISEDELEVMKEISAIWLYADEKKIKLSIEEGILVEVNYEKKI